MLFSEELMMGMEIVDILGLPKHPIYCGGMVGKIGLKDMPTLHCNDLAGHLGRCSYREGRDGVNRFAWDTLFDNGSKIRFGGVDLANKPDTTKIRVVFFDEG